MARQTIKSELLNSLVKAHRNATRKVSRNRSNGIELGGSEFDPRIDLREVRKMNTARIKAQLNNLQKFNSRGTSFISGSDNQPMTRENWEKYLALQTRYNDLGDADRAQYSHIPRAGAEGEKDSMTLGQRMTTLSDEDKTRRRASGEPINLPFARIENEAHNINGEASLKKLISMLERKNRKTYLPEELKKSRRQMMDMVTGIGNPELIKMAKRLNNFQLNALWNYEAFPRAISSTYILMKQRNSRPDEEEDAWIAKTSDAYSSDITEFLKWGLKIGKEKPKT